MSGVFGRAAASKDQGADHTGNDKAQGRTVCIGLGHH